jgi:hypothetical protein
MPDLDPVALHVHLPPELKAWVLKQCEDAHLSTSAYLRALIQMVRGGGLVQATAPPPVMNEDEKFEAYILAAITTLEGLHQPTTRGEILSLIPNHLGEDGDKISMWDRARSRLLKDGRIEMAGTSGRGNIKLYRRMG